MSKQVLMVVGSLRKKSFNRQMAQFAADYLTQRGNEVEFLDYSDVPMMNQDKEYPAPTAVQAVRDKVAQADGVWFFTPEYNGQVPGVLKNLIDWLSRPLVQGDPQMTSAIKGKKVTYSAAAGNSGAAGARELLSKLLHFVMSDVIEDKVAVVKLTPAMYASDELALTDTEQAALRAQADDFMGKL